MTVCHGERLCWCTRSKCVWGIRGCSKVVPYYIHTTKYTLYSTRQSHSPVVRTPPGWCIATLQGGSLVAPEEDASMKATNTVRCTYMHAVHNVIHTVTSCEDQTNTCVVSCSPPLTLERNQTRCSFVKALQWLAGSEVQVIIVRFLSTTEAWIVPETEVPCSTQRKASLGTELL